MKIVPIIVSPFFPQSHARAGDPTEFLHQIDSGTKKHTIRKNPDYWIPKIEQIQKREAYLSIRSWSAKPYKSKQIEHKRIYAQDSIGYQILNHTISGYYIPGRSKKVLIEELSLNDGLSREDFQEWFKGPKINPFIIIHFNQFRY